MPIGLQQSAAIEPVDPFQRRVLHRGQVSPWSGSMDDLDLVETDDALRRRVIVRVADSADGRFDAGTASRSV